MTRRVPSMAFVALLVLVPIACSSAHPAARTSSVNVAMEPTVIGAVGEAADQGSAEAEKALKVGRRLGRVAGVIAAVFGGPESERIDDTIDRYRRTRDAVTVSTVVAAAAAGAVDGAERGFDLDAEFAELLDIPALNVIRTYHDQVDVSFPTSPDQAILANMVTVLAAHKDRAIEIEGNHDAVQEIYDAMVDLGVPVASLAETDNDEMTGVVLHIRILRN